MADPSAASDFAPWLQAGGLLAFASAIWWEIRQIRPFYKAIAEDLAILKDRLQAPEPVVREHSRPYPRATSPTIPTNEWEETRKKP